MPIKNSVIYIFHLKTETLVLHVAIQQVPSSVIVDKNTSRFSYPVIYTNCYGYLNKTSSVRHTHVIWLSGNIQKSMPKSKV